MVTYARALQYLAEQRNPPKKDQPCPLAESIAKLRREVGFYLSFMDEEVFWGVDLPKEEENKPSAPTTAAADTPGATAAVETLPTLKGDSRLHWVEYNITPLPTSDSHRGSSPANHCTTSKEKSPLNHQDHPI